MKKIIYKQMPILIFLTTLSANLFCMTDKQRKELLNAELIEKVSSSKNRKEQLKEIIRQNANKVFFNRHFQEWPKDKSLINLWQQTLEEVGDYIKKSGSKELPPIFDKYFKPRYHGNQRAWAFTSNLSNDISTDLISQISLANSSNEEDKKSKLEEIKRELASSLKDAQKEVLEVTTWRQATTDAKEILLYLIQNIFTEIYKKLEKEYGVSPKIKINQKTPVAVLQQIALAELTQKSAAAFKSISGKAVTEKDIFARTDNMHYRGGNAEKAINQLAQTEGLKRDKKDYTYSQFKFDFIDELIKKKTNNSGNLEDEINTAAELKAKNWFINKFTRKKETELLLEAIEKLNPKLVQSLLILGVNPDIKGINPDNQENILPINLALKKILNLRKYDYFKNYYYYPSSTETDYKKLEYIIYALIKTGHATFDKEDWYRKKNDLRWELVSSILLSNAEYKLPKN